MNSELSTACYYVGAYLVLFRTSVLLSDSISLTRLYLCVIKTLFGSLIKLLQRHHGFDSPCIKAEVFALIEIAKVVNVMEEPDDFATVRGLTLLGLHQSCLLISEKLEIWIDNPGTRATLA